MWDFGNRGSVVLISVTCGCVLVYNAWGAILALASTLFLVVYVCYSLLVNDSLVSPNAYHVLGYLREAVRELGAALHIAYSYGIGYVRKVWHSVRRCYRERFPFRMDRRRASNYQLSSDSYAAAGNAMFKRKDSLPSPSSSSSLSRLDSIDQLSPIPRVPHRSRDILAMDSRIYAGDHNRSPYRQQLVYGKHTSTPVLRLCDQEEDSRNGDVGLISQSREMHTNKITTYAQNHTLSRGENVTLFSPKGSPWGMSISPKMRPRPAGVKTVQTVAGPLLASTRYNIDPKVLTDVSSPGLTTRLTKYATEAKSKLTHQSQYGTGQFPKVNIHANPIPLLNAKLRKMRMPVTVRVAPPDVAKYSPPERQKVLSNICHVENKSPTSVVQVLREISLKRHASMEDVSFDVAKKQKTDGFFNEEREMIIEENKQKRGRDESSKSDEDLSPLSKSLRPTKRTKTRSCYDILNSLSSSINVPVGIKRKAADFSRCGTPDFEKHFKSLESAQPNSSPTVSKSQNLDTSHSKLEFKEIYSRSPEAVNKRSEDFPLVKGILKSSREKLNKTPIIHKTVQTVTKIDDKPNVSTKPVNLTDKLFMRAEPERNEQLKLLMEEPGNIKAKFATNNVEEIKRDDIRNMRQTSMKARLQSMFDAISGKGENKINPDVVIQADDVNAVTPPVTCPVTSPVTSLVTSPVTSPVTCATLNSSTTTTNVVTTPLSTAAVVPHGFSSSPKSDTKAESKRAVTFNLPNVTTPTQTSVPATTTLDIRATSSTATTSDQTKVVSTASAIASTGFLQRTQVSSSVSSAAPTFTFGQEKSVTKTTAVTSSSSLPIYSTNVSSTSSTFASAAVTTTPASSTSTNFLTPISKTPSSLTFTPISSNITLGAKVETNNVVATTSATVSSSITANTQPNPIFAFGGSKLSSSPATSAQTSVPSLLPQTTGTSLLVTTTTQPSQLHATTTASIASFNSVANSGTSSTASIATTSAAPSLFAFGSNSTTSQPPKSDTFIFGQSSTVQKGTNTFGSSSNTQATSLPQVTTKSFNFTSNTLAPTSSSFTASIASYNSVANNDKSSGVATTTSAPSLFTFGSNNTTLQSPKSDTFIFSQSSGAQKGTNTFGNSASSQATSLPQVTTKSFNFTPNTLAPTSSSFTSTNSAFTATTTATPAFGSPSAPAFPLGASTTSSTSSISKPVFVFGASSTPSAASTPIALPAATASNTTGFGTTSNTAVPVFGATTTAAIPQFGATITTAPQFGTSTTSIFATTSSNTTTTTTNIFGTTSQPLFGGTSAPGTTGVFSPKTTAPSMFAQTTSVVSTSNNTVSPGLFSNANVTSTSTTASPSVFGSGSPIFGQTKPSTSFGTAGAAGVIFGGTTTSLFGSNTQTTTAPTFGNTSTSTIAPGFDSANDATTVFGSPSAGTVTNVQTTPAFSATTGIFGSTDNNASSVPIFGANATPSTGAFGATPATNTFGAPNLAFGSASGSNAFGDNKSPFGAPPVSTTGFGTPSTSISSFGASNANNASNSTSNMFVFGNNQKDGQQNPTFSFGSNFSAGSNNPTTVPSTSFQFGSTTSKPASTGFNFTTPLPATPALNFGATPPNMPTFNPSTPGMFSIGSGSTAPRSRSIRMRKPR